MPLSRRGFVKASFAAAGALAAPALAFAHEPALAATGGAQATGSILPPALAEPMRAALERHSQAIRHHDRVGIADFSRHSGQLRFHIVNAESGRTVKSLLVAHGKGSDPGNSGFAQRFSNRPGSNATSLGSYLTGQPYVGRHGRSRRLHGLEAINDKAFPRAIVMHGARYVDHGMATRSGRVGRSLGCFAFEYREIDFVLESLGADRLLLAIS